MNREPKVGDVFPAKATGRGGMRHGTRYWMIISLGNKYYCHHLLGLDREFNIVSTSSYGQHVMAERRLLFSIKDVDKFVARIKKECENESA